MPLVGEVGKEGCDLRGAERGGMALALMEDESARPVCVGVLGSAKWRRRQAWRTWSRSLGVAGVLVMPVHGAKVMPF